MHLTRLFRRDKQSPDMDSKHNRHRRRKPKLDRRNAVKNIDYDASTSPDSSTSATLRSRSLDLPPYSGQKSFRVDGRDGKFDQICKDLGLSGPEDFAIPEAAWEASKVRSSSDITPRSRLYQSATESSKRDDDDDGVGLVDGFRVSVTVSDEIRCEDKFSRSDNYRPPANSEADNLVRGGGIKGVRPPVLAPPPSMSRPVIDKMSSTWDLFRSLAPEGDEGSTVANFEGKSDFEREDEESEEEEEIRGGVGGVEEEVRGVRLGETADLIESCSFSTSNDDDSSSTTTESMFVISPIGRFKRNIKSWIRGQLIGSGSFGTVYEGISDDGFFFAVKEVSLLDRGSQGQQCIDQLEQEIALLSQFEHDNIVQYLGTDKEEGKLFIFLELVTQGSLAKLYQKYNLRDTQVSAYTRQILCGLKYLHDRNVVHRDIKCANILVDANGSVKLADFGLAKQASDVIQLNSCKGSAYWMAPEVVRTQKTHGYGLSADIWSLGCTVLEMLTRQHPYSNMEWAQAMFQIGQGQMPKIPDSLSKDARDFIQQCVQVKPDHRPSALKLLEHPFVKRPLPTIIGSNSPHRNDSRT